MKTKRNLLRPISATAFATMVFALSSPLHSATFTWTGADLVTGSWAPTSTNWDTTPAFNNTADLVFDNVTRSTDNEIGFNRTARSITFGDNIDGIWTTNMTTAAVLTFAADTGNASLDVTVGSTANITFNGGTGFTGSQSLTSQLEIDHNGSGLLTFNRQTAGVGGITKTGTGTFVMTGFNANSFTGPLNVNGGRLVLNNTQGATFDLAAAVAISLGGGTLEARTTGAFGKTLSQNITVSAASVLAYNNTTAVTQTLTIGTGTMLLNSDLTISNISSNNTLVNGINLSRNITGAGDLVVETYNDVASSGANFSLGRVFVSGNNSTRTGNLVVAKGTVSLGDGSVTADPIPVAITSPTPNSPGKVIMGTAGDAFGAGLTFNIGASSTYTSDIVVKNGGFRVIKGAGTNFNATLLGDINLEGDLTVDHTWGATDRRINLNGDISGAGGLTITRVGGNVGTTVRLGGVNTYLGDTLVTGTASLAVAGGSSLTSNVTVQSGGRIGGGGSTSKNLTLASGANFFFFYSLTYAPFTVGGTVNLDPTFGIASLRGGSQGEVVPWSTIPDASYTLIAKPGLTFTTSTISNLGFANRVNGLGTLLDKSAYFENGASGLQLVIITTPGGNNPPTITDIANQSVPSGGNTGALAFTITDEDVNTVTPSGTSSNTTLVPNANIVFGGSGASRTVTVTPVSGLSGSATITVTLTDNGSLTAQDTFTLTVTDNYLSWATANGVTGGINGDSDNDGVKNLVEYALVNGGERGTLTGNTITFNKRGLPFGTDLTYDIESSTLLTDGSWTTLAKPVPVTENASLISYTFTPSSPAKNFARLKVVQVP